MRQVIFNHDEFGMITHIISLARELWGTHLMSSNIPVYVNLYEKFNLNISKINHIRTYKYDVYNKLSNTKCARNIQDYLPI